MRQPTFEFELVFFKTTFLAHYIYYDLYYCHYLSFQIFFVVVTKVPMEWTLISMDVMNNRDPCGVSVRAKCATTIR